MDLYDVTNEFKVFATSERGRPCYETNIHQISDMRSTWLARSDGGLIFTFARREGLWERGMVERDFLG